MTEELNVKIEKVLKTGDAWTLFLAISEKYGRIKCIGGIKNVIPNNNYILFGERRYDPKYKWSFHVQNGFEDFSENSKDVVKTLSSGYIQGVGIKRAKLMVKAFGNDVYDIITNHPERLKEIDGIGDKLSKSIHEQFIEQNIYFELYKLFKGAATVNQISRIIDKYQKNAVEKIKEYPYRLLYEVDGFGWAKVDELALSMGVKEDSPDRIKAIVAYSIKQCEYKNGDCYQTVENIKKIITRLKFLNETITWKKVLDVVSDDLLGKYENKLFSCRKVNETQAIYLRSMDECENKCANIIYSFMDRTPLKPISNVVIERAIAKTELEETKNKHALVKFHDKQKEAVRVSLQNLISTITGGPGTGKTTILKAIIKAWGNNDKILLLAPTGKAARRMHELNPELDSYTIHRVIYSYMNCPENYDDEYLILVDESSMIDIWLAKELLFFAKATNSQIVFIGDADQLPPVGPGMFFKDLISVGVATTKLDVIYRNSGAIVVNANKINHGELLEQLLLDEENALDEFGYIDTEQHDFSHAVMSVYDVLVNKYGIKEVCCLVPVKKESFQVNVRKLNELIRNKYNPDNGHPKLENCDLRVGDRVMQTKNDYNKNVYNGDCGTVIEIDVERNRLVVAFDFDEYNPIEYSPVEASNLILAYAMTVHKSQGSEYKAILLIEEKEHWWMVKRNLIYTGITRAKEQVVIMGNHRTVNHSIEDDSIAHRNTDLDGRIKRLIKNRNIA